MRIIDSFRTQKQKDIILALEQIHMGTRRDILEVLGKKDVGYTYTRHIHNLIDEGVVHVCGHEWGDVEVYALTYTEGSQ